MLSTPTGLNSCFALCGSGTVSILVQKILERDEVKRDDHIFVCPTINPAKVKGFRENKKIDYVSSRVRNSLIDKLHVYPYTFSASFLTYDELVVMALGKDE